LTGIRKLWILGALELALNGVAAPKTVTVQYRFFTRRPQMDGNWAALEAASDGKVYVGLACHGCNGHLVFYDAKTDKIVDVGDLTKLSGESGLNLGPQSKIHAKFGA
jgi:hypothetical protein